MVNRKYKRVRRRHDFFYSACLITLLLTCAYSLGQNSGFSPLKQALNQYGKINNHISDLVVDKRGRIWLGSLNGLMLYDGFSTKTYRIPNVLSGHFQTNTISKLFLQQDSLLWIVNTQGICSFNIKTFKFEGYEIPKNSDTQALNSYFIFSDANNDLWVSWQDLGVLRFNPQSKKFEFPEDSALRQMKAVKSVLPWGKQHLIFSHRSGVNVYNLKLKRSEDIQRPENPFHYLNDGVFTKRLSSLMHRNGDVFIGGRESGKSSYSICKYNLETKDTVVLDVETHLSPYFFKDSNSNLWIYGMGLHVYDAVNNTVHKLETEKNYGFSLCNSVYEDEERNIWLCTNAGLFYYNLDELKLNNLMRQIKTDHTFQLNGGILPIQNGGFWVGTYNDGILTFDKNLVYTGTIKFPSSLGNSNNIICSLYQDWNGFVWIGTLFGNIIRYDLTSRNYQVITDTILNSNMISSITGSPKHGILIANQNGRIVSYSPKEGRFRLLNHDQPGNTPMDYVTKIDLYGDSLVLVCTLNSGFFTLNLNSGKQENFAMNPIKKGAPLTNLFIDVMVSKNRIYASTGSGMVEFDPRNNRFTSLFEDENIPFSECYIITSTAPDQLFVTTSDGIYQMNVARASYSKIGRGTDAEKNTYNIAYSSINHVVAFATEHEVYAFHPEQEAKAAKPKTFIYSLESKDSTIQIHDRIREVFLPRTQNTFKLNIGSLGYRFRDYMEYAYRLNEQEDWILIKGNKEILFHDLPGGSYLIRVRALNTVNREYSDEVSLTVHIEKAFYEKAWFYVLLLIVFLSILYVLYRIRISRLLAIEKVRSKLSRDLHDDMGSTLSTINILSGIIQTKLENDTKTAKEYVERISSYSQDMMDSMQDIVWSINPANDSMNKVMVKMREFASHVLEPKNIQFKFTVEGDPDKFILKMENRRDFFLIFKEAINNAAKYSEADCIDVNLTLKQQHITLLIKDNGKGFDMATVKRGNGLSNMTRRAESIRAELKVHSSPLAGTQIELVVHR